MKRLIPILVLLIYVARLPAQYPNTVRLETAKGDTNRVNELNKLVLKNINTGNYHTADSLAECALQLSIMLNFKRGQANAFGLIGIINWKQGDYMDALKNHFAALKIREENGDKQGIASSHNNIGLVYNEQGDYPKALENYLITLKMDDELGNKPGIDGAYGNIGNVCYAMGNYQEALKNHLLSLKMAQDLGSKRGIGLAYGNIGNVYQKLGNYPEALKNDLEGLNIAIEIGDKNYQGLVYVNIGNLYEEQHSYDEALRNYLKGLKISVDIGSSQTVAMAYLDMGGLLIKERKYVDAKKDLDKGLPLAMTLGNKELIRDAFSDCSTWDSCVGDYKAAYNDFRMFSMYNDSLKNEENTRKILNEQMNYEFDKKLAAEKTEKEKEEIVKVAEYNRRNIILACVALMFIVIAALLIYNQIEKRKRDKIVFENNFAFSEREKELLKLEKQYAEEELHSARKALEEYTDNMLKKTELLKQSEVNVENLKKELDKVKIEQAEHLNKTAILTEQDWDKFRDLFQQVHKDYLTRLKEKMPDLTQAEIRLICLTKMKLGTKNMAGILGVSFDTIRITRYRLRKKLGLSEEDSIDSIAESI